MRYIGPAHGFAGNVLALARGDALDGVRRAELERRAIATLAKYARRAVGLCQWWPTSRAPEPDEAQSIRTQWCHGAPGIAGSFGSLAPDNEQLTELLLGGALRGPQPSGSHPRRYLTNLDRGSEA